MPGHFWQNPGKWGYKWRGRSWRQYDYCLRNKLFCLRIILLAIFITLILNAIPMITRFDIRLALVCSSAIKSYIIAEFGDVGGIEYISIMHNPIIMEGFSSPLCIFYIEGGNSDAGYRNAALWSQRSRYYLCGLFVHRPEIIFWIWWSGFGDIRAMQALSCAKSENDIKRVVGTIGYQNSLQNFGGCVPAVLTTGSKPPQFRISSGVRRIVTGANFELGVL